MENNLGANIRRLRISREMTQEELANYAGVSFQAVSKWECGTTTPDIALLPQLAIFFGVRIDDLFGITNRDELERVEFILTHEKLTDENFAYAKKVLDAALENAPDDVQILKTYARLYLSRNQRDRLEAGKLLRHAMTQQPADAEIFQLYGQVCSIDRSVLSSGCFDFIRECEPYLCKNTSVLELLIPAMIEVRQFARAEEIIAVYKKTNPSLAVIFEGDIKLVQGDTDGAVAQWNCVPSHDHKGQYEIGERFLRICDYERAETAFENSFSAADHPRDLSAIYSLAFMYDRLGNREKAAKMWQRILDVLASDWGITDGETVAWAKRERDKGSNA